MLFVNSGCMEKKTDHQILQEELSSVTDEDLIPNYQTVFTADSIKLDNINQLLELKVIDQKTCLKIISNSCLDLKANYYNYLLNTYKSTDYSDETTTFVDIGNIAHFVILKYKSNDTKCFDKIFEISELI